MSTLNFTPETRMLIDGELVEAEGGRTFDNINPATEEVAGVVADGSKADMQRAIAAARRAFDETDWSTNHAFRQKCILQLQEALEAEQEELREELIVEVGTPRALTYGPQLDAPLSEALRWPANFIDEFGWDRDMGEAEIFGMKNRRAVWKEAMGVVGAIVPWNYPFEVTLNKVGQILATGNTMILKPAPDTPWNATRMGRLVADKTDIPAGVFNVVTALDHLVGEEMTLSPQVDQISFTGSTAVGRRIMEKGAATLKRVFLELGGKSASVLLEDADFEAILPMTAAVCSHAGQGCAMQTRLLVPRSKLDQTIEIVGASMAGWPYGDPQSMEVLQGPVISEKQMHRVLGYIDKGKEEGAQLVTGGARSSKFEKGYFIEPTLFVAENSMTISQEEIFGPVMNIIPFEDEADALRIANDSSYGLSGSVFSADMDRATAFARKVRTGSIGINGGSWYGADMPYGGYKDSGIGRQNGIEGFEQYLETKIVAWPAG